MSNFKVDNLVCNTINGASLGASGGGSAPTFTEYSADNAGTIEGVQFGGESIINLFEKNYNSNYSDILIDYTPDFTEVVTFTGTFNISDGMGTYGGLFGIMDQNNSTGLQFSISNNKIMGYVDSWDNATYSEPMDPNISHNITIKIDIKSQLINMTLDGVVVPEFDNKTITYTDLSTATVTRAEIGHTSHRFNSLTSSIKFEKVLAAPIVEINQEITDTNFTKVEITTKNLDGDLLVNGDVKLSVTDIDTSVAVDDSATVIARLNSGDRTGSADFTEIEVNISYGNAKDGLFDGEFVGGGAGNNGLAMYSMDDYYIFSIDKPMNIYFAYQSGSFSAQTYLQNNETLETYDCGSHTGTWSLAFSNIPAGEYTLRVKNAPTAIITEWYLQELGPDVPTETITMITDTDKLEFSVNGTIDSLDYQTYTSTEIDAIGLIGNAVKELGSNANLNTESFNKLSNLL